MKWEDFKIGKIYINDVNHRDPGEAWAIAKLNENHIVIIRHKDKTRIGKTDKVSFLRDDYRELPLTDLTKEEQEVYHKHVAALAVQGCTCEMSILMASGCQCGWIKVERSRKT